MLGHTRNLTIGLLSALLMAGSALAEPEVTQLGTETNADPLTQCGELAASRWEPGRDGRGVEDDQIFIDGAITACEAALAANPDSAEAKTWLARVYILAGRQEEAEPLLEAAIEAGSALAPYLMSKSTPGDPIEDLILSADRGYAPAQSDLADRYFNENGDINESYRLFQLAADQGFGFATLKLGMFARYGWIADADYVAAADLYQRAIDEGEPKAYFELGQLHEQGQGFAQDYLKAAELYQQGADLGEEWSQTELAYLYEYGLGVTKDFDKSFALLSAAEPSGYGFALAALAVHYMFGQGTEIDYDRAYNLAWAAQRKNIVYAEGLLGYMFQYGLGAERDLSSALFHYQEGSTKGDQYSNDQIPIVDALIACQDAAGSPYEPGGIGHGRAFDDIVPDEAIPACENATSIDSYAIGNFVWLARAYVRDERYVDAVPLLEQGIADGNVLAHVVMGDLLMAGMGVEEDHARAVSLYEAVAKDFGLAQYSLGVAYRLGLGVPADREQAMHWLRMAQESGVVEADAEIAGMLAEPDGNVIDLTGFGREGPGY